MKFSLSICSSNGIQLHEELLIIELEPRMIRSGS